jgi:hypothetical protein
MEAQDSLSWRYFTDGFEPQNLVMMLSQVTSAVTFHRVAALCFARHYHSLKSRLLVRFDHVACMVF